MIERTKASYRKLAQHFYGTRLKGQQPSPKRLADALVSAAPEYRPGYWRKLRNALAFDQSEKGFREAAERLAVTKNPLTVPDAPPAAKKQLKSKQKRVKSIASADFKLLTKAAAGKADWTLLSALLLADKLGCRPSEMRGVRPLGGGFVFIPGSKKTADRGLDRTIKLSAKSYEAVVKAAAILANEDSETLMRCIQERLHRLTKKLWPRRKARMTLYSFRHQLGSDLKASGMSRLEIAYIMGHQSTASVDVYGDRRKASKARQIEPGVDKAQISSLVREKHEAPYGTQVKGQKVASALKSPGMSR